MIYGDNFIVRLEDRFEKLFSFRLFLLWLSFLNLYFDDLISMWKIMRDLMVIKVFFVICNFYIIVLKVIGVWWLLE